ncbi:MAG: serine/threonine-protein kinase [Acidobacteriia bacterium]|nr:serine/threonine-protein kinase [Terriglobia bacterium]
MNNPPSLGTIGPEDFRRIREVFESALEHSPADRATFVEHACGGNALLVAEVERMLAADSDGNSLLDHNERLRPGTIFANYLRITGFLGRGGMGEVYRARDVRLNRDVALKILPETFASNADRLARFKREAQLLASLNHPNIAAIYGFEESNGMRALVLELVEGPTLADRIAQGPIPIDEAVVIARQIAEALEAAHEQGIIHRDLKPANVKLRPDAAVKVLDFGLAKGLQPAEVAPGSTGNSPTLTSPAMTAAGVLLGTASYMAPEQAKGRAVDRRADIWAFGAVFYEMLSGQRAFKGEDISEALASVLRQDIDWNALPSSTPASLRNLMARCLDRDIRHRLRDIGEARIVLEEPGSALPGDKTPRARLSRRALPLVLVAIGAGVLGGSAAWFLRPSPAGQVARLSFALPEGQSLFANRGVIAVSPDGSQIVYATTSGLHLRPMAGRESKPIRGTEGFFNLTEPVFSPDGQSIAFHTGSDHTIKKVPVTGGVAVTICHSTGPYSLNWDPGGILFGELDVLSQPPIARIMRVPGNGGTPQTLVTFKSGEMPNGPQMLPGGRNLMFSLATGSAPDRWDHARIVVQSLTSGEQRTIIEGGSDARVVPTGHLVYALGGSLFAVAFDLSRLEVLSDRVAVVEGITRASADAPGAAHFSFSRNGTLIYLANSSSAVPWLKRAQGTDIGLSDRNGKVEPLKLPPRPYESPRVSPDGTRIAFGTDDGNEAIVWTYDLSGRSAIRRLTFGGHDRFPTWYADSKRVVFQSGREGDSAIFWQAVDSGKAERLTRPAPGESHEPQACSPKGDWLLFDVMKATDVSLWTYSFRDRKATPFSDVHSAVRTGAVFSPDGQWVAYGSSEGRTLYVEPFPPTGIRHQFPSKDNRPNQPVWSPDGKEIFYIPGPGQFASVGIMTKPAFMFGNAVVLSREFLGAPSLVRRPYDITPDGKFVSTIRPGQAVPGNSDAGRIQVVLNWFEDLRARVPVTR